MEGLGTRLKKMRPTKSCIGRHRNCLMGVVIPGCLYREIPGHVSEQLLLEARIESSTEISLISTKRISKVYI